MKFKHILALVFAIALGYGAGQQGGKLWATDYPSGGVGSHDVAANVHGLGSGINVLGSREASNLVHQRLDSNPAAFGTSDLATYISSETFTFGTAYSATPDCMIGGTTDDQTIQGAMCVKVTTTTYDFYGITTTSALNLANIRAVTIGAP
ncbi:hypothetical protein LCGC14_2014310 [marine sediment metagenome]|uniref:Uncharacterized protein n=1 Tax=marine sediment metagenome TaxID=412755 RepID=A0A0F9HCR6_9ZZZZ